MKKKKSAVFMLFLLGITCLHGCGVTAVTSARVPRNTIDKVEESGELINVIINDRVIKGTRFGPLYSSKLEEVFSRLFQNVSVRSGYEKPQLGELLITPQTITYRRDSDHESGRAESTVIVSYSNHSDRYIINGMASLRRGFFADIPWLKDPRSSYALVGIAFEDIAIRLLDEVLPTPRFQSYAETVRREKMLPADLRINLRFNDTASIIPNDVIDAGEKSVFTVFVKNEGQGTAFDVKIETDVDYNGIEVPATITVGDIPPGATRETAIEVNGSLDMASGKAPILIHCTEKRGYDSKKVKLLISTAHLERPDLVITEYKINDGKSGLARGNGNGIPESGETIEVTVFIQNLGPGPAIGVNLVSDEINSGINWEKDRITVGTIPPGEIVKAKVAFSIPRGFDAREILSLLKADDVRGVSHAEKKVTLAYSKISPRLEYAWRILSQGREVKTIINGEAYELELTVRNEGKLLARDVVMNVTSAKKVPLDRRRMDLGMIQAESSYPVQRITFSLPRGFTEPQLPLNVKLSQSNFSPNQAVINISVNVKSPRLFYQTRLMSSAGGNTLEKGEGATLEVQILNQGTLPAEGVKISMESRERDLSLIGTKEHFIGRIPANSRSETVKFQLATKRRISVGTKSLDVRLTQNDFPPALSQYALHITEEYMSVIDLASEEAGRSSNKTSSGSKLAPTIKSLSLQSGETVESESVYLAVDVTDYRNVESVRVEVNGVVLSIPEDVTGVEISTKRKIRTNVPLREGDNRIVVYAYNSDNLSARKEIRITRKPEEDVDIPPITRMKNPDAVAVVIGISRFQNPDIPIVDYARRDAETMKKYLVHTLGFEERNVIELYDENALLANLKATFRSKLPRRIEPDRSDVFIFYSGHGVPGTNKEPCLVPYNFDPYAIDDTGYNLNEFYEDIARFEAKSVTIVLDACFSGSSERGLVVKGISPVFLEVKNPVMKAKNTVVITSSTGQQVSSWYQKKQHGLFTYYFLMGLRGAADENEDSQITVEEMKKYLDANVTKQARYLYNREQQPQVLGDKKRVLINY